ncbi:baseplate wedge protein [Xanthomonas phage NEB7]|nr:baseplate wedge protein [Xanthomonas phage NEB7]
MSTNVPLPKFLPTGLSVPSEPEILAGVQTDWIHAFALSGKALNAELTTPQGQLQQTQAFILAAINAQLLELVANIDPMTSSGAWQDALGRIYFLTRQPATYATVQATVRGTVGQVLPLGAQARSSDGSLWASTQAVTFGTGGAATVVFRAVQIGAGPAAGVNDLTIYQQQTGWESISNATGSVPGLDVESRQSFEERRASSVNIGGNGTASAVRAAIANVTGVTDVFIYNNGSVNPIRYGATNYPIPAHSLGISVAGGADADIAAAIHSKLDCGCGLPTAPGLGTLITQLIEDSEFYAEPYPTYLIRFVRPAPVTIYVTVNVANLSTLPSTYVQSVQNAVATALTTGFATPDGSITVDRARIGGQIVAAEYFAAVLALRGITPVSIFIGTSPSPTSGAALTMGIDQLPVCTPLAVTVNAVAV